MKTIVQDAFEHGKDPSFCEQALTDLFGYVSVKELESKNDNRFNEFEVTVPGYIRLVNGNKSPIKATAETQNQAMIDAFEKVRIYAAPPSQPDINSMTRVFRNDDTEVTNRMSKEGQFLALRQE